jgi:hypothetical protein
MNICPSERNVMLHRYSLVICLHRRLYLVNRLCKQNYSRDIHLEITDALWGSSSPTYSKVIKFINCHLLSISIVNYNVGICGVQQ